MASDATSGMCADCGQAFTEQDRERPKRNGYPYFPECCAVCALARQKVWKSKRGKAFYQHVKSDRGEYARHRERLQHNHRKRTFGLSDEEYQRLFRVQQGLCAACGQPETRIDKRSGVPRELAVDHDHASGKVRALLCFSCNTVFGLLNEDPARITLLLTYALRQKESR